jgi:hypothetical protein
MNELIQYVRNKKNQRVGVVVAVKNSNPENPFTLGWSMCRVKLDKFNKSRGIFIARERASKTGTLKQMPRLVKPVFDKMIERGYKYFKATSAS